MTRTSTFPLHDRLTDGRLSSLLRELRGEGLSYFEIAVRVRQDLGIETSTETVRRWIALLPPPPE